MQHAKAGQRHRPRIPTVLKSSQAMTQSLTTGLSNFHCSILNVSYLKSMSCLKRFFYAQAANKWCNILTQTLIQQTSQLRGENPELSTATHTHTPEGLSWPVRRQNLPIVMLVTFLCSAYGDEAVWIVISRRFLVNLAKFFFFFYQKCNQLRMNAQQRSVCLHHY